MAIVQQPHPDGKCCRKCGVFKAFGDYHRNTWLIGRIADVCKECVRQETQKRYAKQREANSIAKQERDALKEERKRALQEAKRATPKPFSRAGLSDQEKRDRRAMQARQWREKNETHYQQSNVAYNNNRRARKLAAVGSYTKAEWVALCAYYGGYCVCCKQKKPLTADHVVPLSKGGSNDIGNIQPLCKSCNSRKGTKAIDYR